MGSDSRAAIDEATEAAWQFTDAWRDSDIRAGAEATYLTLTEDGGTARLTETQLRTVLVALGRLTRQQDHAEFTTALADLRDQPDGEFADLRAFCATWLAELEQHGWLSRRLLLADGSELDVGQLAQALGRLAQLKKENAQLLSGSVPRSMSLALACISCHDCVGVFVTKEALENWAAANGWRDGYCPNCEESRGGS
jgi:hypothetical protein